jgi:hypothetical protein
MNLDEALKNITTFPQINLIVDVPEIITDEAFEDAISGYVVAGDTLDDGVRVNRETVQAIAADTETDGTLREFLYRLLNYEAHADVYEFCNGDAARERNKYQRETANLKTNVDRAWAGLARLPFDQIMNQLMGGNSAEQFAGHTMKAAFDNLTSVLSQAKVFIAARAQREAKSPPPLRDVLNSYLRLLYDRTHEAAKFGTREQADDEREEIERVKSILETL